jgi:PAS domain S-box-containing protein
MARMARTLVILALVVGGYLFNQLEWLEREIMDLRARLDSRQASTDLVLVQIDEPSLREFPVWPWPRRLYAEAIERLADAGVRQIALDVDFSSRSNPEDDAILARALSLKGVDFVLPVFRQPVARPDGGKTFLESLPIPELIGSNRLAAFNVQPDSDGKVRRMQTRERWQAGIVAHYAALLAGRHGRSMTTYYLDYSIAPGTIPKISFADVVKGRFDPALVRGRNILIGATALQLGDMVPVPLYGSLPGAVVQALAYSSLANGRAIQRLHPGYMVALIALVVLALQLACRGSQWRRSLAITGGMIVTVSIAAYTVQARHPLYIDLAPVLIAAAVDFFSRLMLQVRRQDVQLLLQSLALRRRDMFMRLVVENSFDAIFTLKPDGEVLTYNHAAEEVFGRPRDEVIGGNVAKLFEGLQITGGGDLADLLAHRGIQEVSCRKASGELLTLDLSIGQVRTGEEPLIIVLARDITSRRAAEAQARKAQENLREAIESIDAGFALFDKDDRLAIANSRYMRKRGLTAALGFRPHHDEITRAVAAAGHYIIETGSTEDWIEQRIARHRSANSTVIEQTSDGQWILTSARPTHDGGTIVVETDITILKQREAELIEARDQAESANRTKTEFLAAMSHELRTPLNAIIGFSEMMTRQVYGPLGSENYTGYANDIHSSGKHLLAIINDILDMAKIEAGQFVLNEAAMSVAEAVTGAASLLKEKAQAKNQDYDVLRPARGLGLQADGRIVRQVLLNLISNAIKFTPEGGRVGVESTLREDGSCAITISDTGIGMSEDDLRKALEPFGQVQSSLSRAYEGTGLGLPLVDRFMKMHDGRLEIESRPGEGTRATVVFPPARVIAPRERAKAGAG